MKKHTKRSIIVWITSVVIIVFGFLPYRLILSRGYNSTENIILVEHHECTCCSDFQITQGKISIPDSLTAILTYPFEIEVVGKSTPLNQFTNENATLDLIVSNSIILQGEVVGVDSLYPCEHRPIFSVKKWGLKSYYPRFLTFGITGILSYLFICSIAIIFSIVRVIRQFIKPK